MCAPRCISSGTRQDNQQVTPKAQQLVVGGTKKGCEEGWATQQGHAHPSTSSP